MDWLEYIVFRFLRLMRGLPLNRILNKGISTRVFADYFKNFEKLEAVRGIFGEKTEEILRNLKVDFTWFGGFDNQSGLHSFLCIDQVVMHC